MKTLHLTIIAVLAIGITTGTVYATNEIAPADQYLSLFQASLQNMDLFYGVGNSDIVYAKYTDYFDTLTPEEQKTRYAELGLRYETEATESSVYINKITYVQTEIEKMIGLPVRSHTSLADVSYLDKLQEKLDNTNTNNDGKIAQLEAKIAELKEDKQNKNAHIDKLKDRLENQNTKFEDKLDKKNAKIDQLENKIVTLKETIDRKDTNIDKKKEKLGAMKGQMSDMKDEMRVWKSTSYYSLFGNGDIAGHTYKDENGKKVWKSWFDNDVLKYHKYVDENGNKVVKEWNDNGVLIYHDYIDENGNKVVKEWNDNGTPLRHDYIDENGHEVYKTFTINGTLYRHNYYDSENSMPVQKGWYYYYPGIPEYEYYGDYVKKGGHARYNNMFETVKTWWNNGQMKLHASDWNSTTKEYDLYKTWHPTGQIKFEVFTNENGDEWVIRYYANGQVSFKMFIDENGDEGVIRYYANGQVSEHVWNIYGSPQPVKKYYENGQMEWQRYYVNGTSNVETWTYHENNQIKEHIHRIHASNGWCGSPSFITYYYENGQIAYESGPCGSDEFKGDEDGEVITERYMRWNSTSWSWYDFR